VRLSDDKFLRRLELRSRIACSLLGTGLGEFDDLLAGTPESKVEVVSHDTLELTFVVVSDGTGYGQRRHEARNGSGKELRVVDVVAVHVLPLGDESTTDGQVADGDSKESVVTTETSWHSLLDLARQGREIFDEVTGCNGVLVKTTLSENRHGADVHAAIPVVEDGLEEILQISLSVEEELFVVVRVGFLKLTEVTRHAVDLGGGELARLGQLNIWLAGLDIGGRLVDVVDEHGV
jgi:hypothetical protein